MGKGRPGAKVIQVRLNPLVYTEQIPANAISISGSLNSESSARLGGGNKAISPFVSLAWIVPEGLKYHIQKKNQSTFFFFWVKRGDKRRLKFRRIPKKHTCQSPTHQRRRKKSDSTWIQIPAQEVSPCRPPVGGTTLRLQLVLTWWF